MQRLGRAASAAALALALLLTAGTAESGTLNIRPIAQQTPVWCWAAASEMVLRYYGFPNLNPAGNFQCAVVGTAAPQCSANCTMCISQGGTTGNIARVMRNYAAFSWQFLRFEPDDTFEPDPTGPLDPDEIISQIDDDAPILAGVSPSGVRYPPGAGMSQHAVVIVGYAGDEDDLTVIVNDPYPYGRYDDPYLRAGAQMLRPGRYAVPYDTFVDVIGYDNSIVFN